MKYSGQFLLCKKYGCNMTNVCKFPMKLGAWSINNISQIIWYWLCLGLLSKIYRCNFSIENGEYSTMTSYDNTQVKHNKYIEYLFYSDSLLWKDYLQFTVVIFILWTCLICYPSIERISNFCITPRFRE